MSLATTEVMVDMLSPIRGLRPIVLRAITMDIQGITTLILGERLQERPSPVVESFARNLCRCCWVSLMHTL
jgi:hypothetical protein